MAEPIWSENDHHYMRQALALAGAQKGRTGTNPAVGCVMVRDGVIIGQGATSDGGRPHGEAVALAHAGRDSIGATAYVTLEPCAHISTRGPDCSQLLVDASLSRVVCCLEDPDPRTAGKGFQRLRDGGVRVEIGLCRQEGHDQIDDFIDFMRKTSRLKL
jgi:diaminohydroxyphosphoribosylaminopyrimidine deaminase/5-amino-6-(5-phosphoribosylamino)uracil reductase